MILITGAAGFIGSAVAYALNRQGKNDLILCDGFRDSDKWKNIVGLHYNRFIHRDELFDFLMEDPLAKEIKAVIHLGACSDIPAPSPVVRYRLARPALSFSAGGASHTNGQKDVPGTRMETCGLGTGILAA